MSLDITFQKEFTMEDVENKTSITVQYVNNNWWLSKNGVNLLIKSYTKSESPIEHPTDVNNEKKNIIDGITCYALNNPSEIMDELVLTFQTKFITDEEEEMYYHDTTIDVDNLYTETTKKFGYKIENDVISK